MRFEIAVITAVVLAACGAPVQQQPPPDQTVTITNPDNVVHTQGNSTPVATIQGYVSDAVDGNPLENVTVTILVNGQAKQATSAGGVYALTQVPAGSSYRMVFTKNGYARRVADVEVPGNSGNFPQGNVTVEHDELMYVAGASIQGTVKDFRGDPVDGAKVVADLRPLGFDIVASTLSAVDGSFRLGGLPGDAAGLQVDVAALPMDTNGDMLPDLGGATAKVYVFPGLTSVVTLRMKIGAGVTGELLANGSFEDGTGCTLDGWTTGTTSTIPAPAASMDTAVDGTCSARLGASTPGGTGYLSGYSYAYQDVPIPDGVTLLRFSAQYSPDTNYAYTGHDRQACELRTTSGAVLASMFNVTSNAATFAPVSYDISGVANQTVRVYCYVYGDGSHWSGMYLDAVSLLIVN